MSTRRAVPVAVVTFSFALLFFGLGNYLGARQGADHEAQFAALRAELNDLRRTQLAVPTGTTGVIDDPVAMNADRAAIVDDVKRQLTDEMGLLPLNLLRDRRESFVELYSYDDRGASSYGTAGYLGNGYFITVKHGVVALGQEGAADPRKITSVKIAYQGKLLNARVIDVGDAKVEVDPGDWAIVKVEGKDRPAGAEHRSRIRLRLRRSDLPAGQRLLEGDHRVDRLCRAEDAEQPGHVSHRRPPGGVGWRRVERRRGSRRHPGRPDAGRLPVLVHPAAPRGDVQEGVLSNLRRGAA